MPTHRGRHPSRVTESWQNFVALVNSFSGGHELAFRQALFTAVGQFFLVLVLLICYQLYLILQTFLKPLVWAALTGTVLFPLKSFLAFGAREWIQSKFALVSIGRLIAWLLSYVARCYCRLSRLIAWLLSYVARCYCRLSRLIAWLVEIAACYFALWF